MWHSLWIPLAELAQSGAAGKGPEYPGMWKSLTELNVPWYELVLRSVAVYAFLLVILRVTGKRQIGQLAPFDLVLLLVLSNAVQNAMNAGDNTLLGGIISAVTLIASHYAVAWGTYRSKLFEGIVEGRPQILIHNGKIITEVMRKAKMTHHELNAALRQSGCACATDVQLAVLENNGAISVIPRREGQREMTHEEAKSGL